MYQSYLRGINNRIPRRTYGLQYLHEHVYKLADITNQNTCVLMYRIINHGYIVYNGDILVTYIIVERDGNGI